VSARAKKAAVGERLPYLLSKLKAPRVLERLEQTAERARAEEWPYERFLEALLEAEVFARDASGARQRIRHAGFPARKTLEDFDWAAQPAAERPLVTHLAVSTSHVVRLELPEPRERRSVTEGAVSSAGVVALEPAG
jgi:DNA replication protein DnaC